MDSSVSARGAPRRSVDAVGSLIAELALVGRGSNRIAATDATFEKATRPNTVQARALELVGLDPRRL